MEFCMCTVLRKSLFIFLWLALVIGGGPLTVSSQAMVLAQNPGSFSGTIDDPDIEVIEPGDKDGELEQDAVMSPEDTVAPWEASELEKVETDDLRDIFAEDLEVDEAEEPAEEEPKPSIEPMKTLLEEEPEFQFDVPRDTDPDEITGLGEEILAPDIREDLQGSPLREFDIPNDIMKSPLLKYGIHDDLQNSFLLKYELRFSGKEGQMLTEKNRSFGNYPKEGIAPKVGTSGYWNVPYKKIKKKRKSLDESRGIDEKEGEFAH